MRTVGQNGRAGPVAVHLPAVLGPGSLLPLTIVPFAGPARRREGFFRRHPSALASRRNGWHRNHLLSFLNHGGGQGRGEWSLRAKARRSLSPRERSAGADEPRRGEIQAERAERR